MFLKLQLYQKSKGYIMKKYIIRYSVGMNEKVFTTYDVVEFSDIVGVLSKLKIDYTSCYIFN